MDDNYFFSTELITVPIGLRFFANAQLSLSETIWKKWDLALLCYCQITSQMNSTMVFMKLFMI